MHLTDLESCCYALLYENLDIRSFEQWVYGHSEIEQLLGPDDYLELISLDFGKRSIRHDVERLLEKHLDYGKFETSQILSILRKALASREELPRILTQLYDMYCHGYSFLEDLGLGYGLLCKVPRAAEYEAETWEDLEQKERTEILDCFYPQIEADLSRAVVWLERGEIVLTGIRNEMNPRGFTDNRTAEAKQSSVWREIRRDKESGASVSKNLLWESIAAKRKRQRRR